MTARGTPCRSTRGARPGSGTLDELAARAELADSMPALFRRAVRPPAAGSRKQAREADRRDESEPHAVWRRRPRGVRGQLQASLRHLDLATARCAEPGEGMSLTVVTWSTRELFCATG